MPERRGRGTAEWTLVAVCWAVVLVPLAWGVLQTVQKAAKLFQ
ncbi:MAG: hypothetical protein NW201_02800 [Gemmatimonadales bacterium]|nr:hypothetical protein [Gemmatimonadales bacterium]